MGNDEWEMVCIQFPMSSNMMGLGGDCLSVFFAILPLRAISLQQKAEG